MKEIVHDPGCGVLLVRAVFRDIYKLKLKKELFVAAEDNRTEPGLGDLASGSRGKVAKIPMDWRLVAGARVNSVCRWMSASRDTQSKMHRNEHPCVVPMWTVLRSLHMQVTWHDISCTVKPRPSRPLEIASPPTRCQNEPTLQMWRSKPPFAVARRTLQAHRA